MTTARRGEPACKASDGQELQVLAEEYEMEAALGSEDSLEPLASEEGRGSLHPSRQWESRTLRGKLDADEAWGREREKMWWSCYNRYH